MKTYTINDLTNDTKIKTYTIIKGNHPLVTQKQVIDCFNKLALKETKETSLTIDGERVSILKGW